jgi:uncharacterized membrane protein YdjX (TVP38/TMEM64 family)
MILTNAVIPMTVAATAFYLVISGLAKSTEQVSTPGASRPGRVEGPPRTVEVGPPSGEQPEHAAQGWMALALSIAAALAVTVYVGSHVAEVEVFMARIGLFGPLLSIALQTLFGASPVPTEPLTAINGVVFGPYWATLYSWIGYMLASLVEYRIGLRLRRLAEHEERLVKLPFGLGRFAPESPWFLMLARVIPGYGPKTVGLVGGMYRVPLWRFIWTGAIPSFIGAALFAVGGFSLRAFFQ